MAVGYAFGEVAYDLDASERGPWFSVHAGPHTEFFSISTSGTWEGTLKLVTRSPTGTIVDVADASYTANTGEQQILTQGGREFAFDFDRTSGTVSALAFSASAMLDWSNAIRLQGITDPGVLLLETSKPISLEG
jgi:hypothetical protein